MNAQARYLGVDLGGTKIAGVVLDGASRVRASQRVATPAGDYAATVRAIHDLVIALEREAGASTLPVGIGTPGSVTPGTGLHRNANSTCLNGQPFFADLQATLQRPLRMANDADCLALSESTDGAGREAASLFAVILGTGVGGGLVLNGGLLQGRNALAGEWGHLPLPWMQADEQPARRCWCGLDDCIETWLSGPGLSTDHARAAGVRHSAEAIARAATAGDQAAAETLRRYGVRLARALAMVINLVDPEVIVLGGGLSRIEQLYEVVPQHWTRWAFSERIETRLLPAAHGDASGVRGAAWLWSGDKAR